MFCLLPQHQTLYESSRKNPFLSLALWPFFYMETGMELRRNSIRQAKKQLLEHIPHTRWCRENNRREWSWYIRVLSVESVTSHNSSHEDFLLLIIIFWHHFRWENWKIRFENIKKLNVLLLQWLMIFFFRISIDVCIFSGHSCL